MQERWLSVGEMAAYLGASPDPICLWSIRKKRHAHKLRRLRKRVALELNAWGKAVKAVEDNELT